MKRRATNQKSTSQAVSKGGAPGFNLSRRQRAVFRIATGLLVPLFFLASLEGALRLAGYGYPTHFFLRSKLHGQNVVYDNQRFGWQFFPATAARTPRPTVFPAIKPPGTCRIFVFGESAAYGDPSPAFGLPRVLQALLRAHHPDIHFEVVNVAMTAINSNVILPIARDCAAEHGDFWVLYIGNNEVVGPFGAGTVFGPQIPSLAFIRGTVALKETRIGQMLADLGTALVERNDPARRSTIGLDLFLDHQLRKEDPRIQKVYQHFAGNLREIVAIGTASGAQVLVSTVSSNLKDCAPFASLHRSDLTTGQMAQWKSYYTAGVKADAIGNLSDALTNYHQAGNIDDRYADLQFRQARALWLSGHFEGARHRFQMARDFDTLRVRADTGINGIIHKVSTSAKNSAKVYFVDGNAVLEEKSPQGVVGEEFLYEHVHLNFSGNYLLGRAFAEQISALLPGTVAGRISTLQPREWLTETEVSSQLGLNDYERYKALEVVRQRLEGPPFTTQLNHLEQYERLTATIARLRAALNKDALAKAVATTRSALALAPGDWMLHQQLAELLTQSGQRQAAAQEWRMVVDAVPHYAAARCELGKLLIESGQIADAMHQLHLAVNLLPNSLEALNGLGCALAANGQLRQAIQTYRRALKVRPDSVDTLINLGRSLSKNGQQEEAKASFAEALRLKPDQVEAQLELSKLGDQPAQAAEAVKYFSEALQRNPRDAVAHFQLGQAFDSRGQVAEARTHYAQAVQLQPEFAEARCQLGIALGKEGRTAEAAEQFAQAVRLKPDFAQAHVNLGVAFAKQHKFQEATREFEEALRLDPNDTLAQKSLAAARRSARSRE